MINFNIRINQHELTGFLAYVMDGLTEEEQKLLHKIYNKLIDKMHKDIDKLKLEVPDFPDIGIKHDDTEDSDAPEKPPMF